MSSAPPDEDRSHRRRTVLVVGGTGGIGSAVAERFAALGCEVIAAGLDAGNSPPSLAAVARTAELDVTRADDVEELVGTLERLDVLVNAAGVIRRGEEYKLDVFAEVLDVNLTGTMRACVAAQPLLAASSGCIVNVASMLSYFGGPLVPGYSASKGGVVQLTKALAVGWAHQGIRVNAVAPGWIRTELTSGVRDDPAAAQRIVDRTPMRRWGEPSDVAGAVVFLSGPDAQFITGVVLPVDGGYLAA
jgi:NAD(P)-dependent dehydrogenase (short-subunit alcohol dehydrogenase family)